ncbi:MAG: PAS domain-containing protein [Promethearchaeota archaeon]
MPIDYQDLGQTIFSEKEFIENSLLGIGVLQNGRILYANNTLLRIFGYNFDEVRDYNFWMDVIHPEDLPKVKTEIEVKLKGEMGSTTRYRCRVLLKSGEFRWIEVFSKNFSHNEKKAILFTTIEIPKPTPLIEISTSDSAKLNVIEELLTSFKIPYKITKPLDKFTEIDRREEFVNKIKESYERYEKVINNITDVTIEVNPDGTFGFVSPQSFDVFGYRPQELTGVSLFDFVHPDDLPFITEKLKEAVMKGEILSTEFRTRHKNGQYIPVFSRGGVYREQGTIKFVGIVRNISERKSLEEKFLSMKNKCEELSNDLEEKVKENIIKLKETKEMFHHLLETSPFAVILMNFKGTVIECNSTVEKIFKYKKHEILGKNLLEVITFPAQSLSKLETSHSQLTQGQHSDPLEVQCYTKDGNLIWIKTSRTLLKLYNEILVQLIIHDITETETFQ